MRSSIHLRSLSKALTWRFSSTCMTVLISLLVTGSIKMALTIGSGEVVFKIVLYYVHELIWARIPWGIPRIKDKEKNNTS